MYRTALKLLDSWAIDRQVFLTEATALRTQVNGYKRSSDNELERLSPIMALCGCRW